MNFQKNSNKKKLQFVQKMFRKISISQNSTDNFTFGK